MDQQGLASIARLLADGTRATVCCALLDGRAWTAGELARATHVAPSTMSEHLTRLVDGGLLAERRQGRHRYVALAGPEAASALEQLLALTEPAPPQPTLRAVTTAAALRRARTCYDHLAGRLGVAVTTAMTERGLLDDALALTPAGRTWLADDLGAALPRSTRPTTRACLDWTERRPHLAGAAGAVLLSTLLDRRWAHRLGPDRAIATTPDGDRSLHTLLGIERGSWAD